MAVVFVEVIDVYDASKDEGLKNYLARKIEEQARKGKERRRTSEVTSLEQEL